MMVLFAVLTVCSRYKAQISVLGSPIHVSGMTSYFESHPILTYFQTLTDGFSFNVYVTEIPGRLCLLPILHMRVSMT